MAKQKLKLTAAEKAAKKKRRQEFMTVFMNGKMKCVRCPAMIEGMDADEFISANPDPVFLHENQMWELMGEENFMTDTGTDHEHPLF